MRVAVENLERRLADIPQRLERLRKSGQAKLSRRDGEARFLRERGGYALGYTAEIAVSQGHLIVTQRVTLNPCDVPALVPLVKEVEERTVASPEKALADAGFYSNQNVRELEARGIDVYVPDPNLARELNTSKRAAYDWAQPGAQSGTESHAEEIAQPGGTASVRTSQDAGGTGVWRAQATAWDAAISHPGTSQGGDGVYPGSFSLQSHPAVRPQAGTGKPTNRGNWRDRKAEQGACQRQTKSHAHTSSCGKRFQLREGFSRSVMASSLSAPSATLQPRLILRFASRQILSPHYNRTHAPEDRHPPRRRHRSRSHR